MRQRASALPFKGRVGRGWCCSNVLTALRANIKSIRDPTLTPTPLPVGEGLKRSARPPASALSSRCSRAPFYTPACLRPPLQGEGWVGMVLLQRSNALDLQASGQRPRSRGHLIVVIPAKAGIHFSVCKQEESRWIPAFAGMTASKVHSRKPSLERENPAFAAMTTTWLRSWDVQLPACVERNARAYCQSRSTVRDDRPVTSATRGSGRPAK